MADTSSGLSGPALGALSIGALLVYAGFRGVSPLQALRDVSSGKPPSVKNEGGNFNPIGTASNIAAGLASRSPFGVAVASAAEARKDEKYSKAKRAVTGYSDCSSFAAEAFRDAGLKITPALWTTMTFRTSPNFKVIETANANAGDIIITPLATLSNAHMAVVIRSNFAIGQQNPQSNVSEGSFTQIMAGKPSFIAMRYIGPLPFQYRPGASSAEGNAASGF